MGDGLAVVGRDVHLHEAQLLALAQEAGLGDMLWKPAPALAEISRWTPLEPGDVVYLGTPAGVAPIGAGDLLRVEVAGIGALENPVVAG